MRSALRIVERRCATMKLVRPCMSLSNASWICTSVRVSILEVASSRISIDGRQSMTRVMQRSCLCPWLKLSSWSIVSSPSVRRRMNPRLWDRLAASRISSSVASGFPIQIFSRTVPDLIHVSWRTIPKLCLREWREISWMFCSSMEIEPLWTS